MRNPALRFGAALALGLLCGIGIAILLVMVITVADLYIAGHGIDLPGWQVARELLLLGVTGATILFCTWAAWKSLGSRPEKKKPE